MPFVMEAETSTKNRLVPSVSGKTQYAEIEPGSKKVTSEVELSDGENHLHTVFDDNKGSQMTPYFVYVTKRS